MLHMIQLVTRANGCTSHLHLGQADLEIDFVPPLKVASDLFVWFVEASKLEKVIIANGMDLMWRLF